MRYLLLLVMLFVGVCGVVSISYAEISDYPEEDVPLEKGATPVDHHKLICLFPDLDQEFNMWVSAHYILHHIYTVYPGHPSGVAPLQGHRLPPSGGRRPVRFLSKEAATAAGSQNAETVEYRPPAGIQSKQARGHQGRHQIVHLSSYPLA